MTTWKRADEPPNNDRPVVAVLMDDLFDIVHWNMREHCWDIDGEDLYYAFDEVIAWCDIPPHPSKGYLAAQRQKVSEHGVG